MVLDNSLELTNDRGIMIDTWTYRKYFNDSYHIYSLYYATTKEYVLWF